MGCASSHAEQESRKARGNRAALPDQSAMIARRQQEIGSFVHSALGTVRHLAFLFADPGVSRQPGLAESAPRATLGPARKISVANFGLAVSPHAEMKTASCPASLPSRWHRWRIYAAKRDTRAPLR